MYVCMYASRCNGMYIFACINSNAVFEAKQTIKLYPRLRKQCAAWFVNKVSEEVMWHFKP